jgi:hypothetical protein
VKGASDYLAYVSSLILLNSQVQHWQVVREEQQGESGLFRYRLSLQNGDMLEIFERFDVIQQQVAVNKYSYHWQRADGQLVRLWDNAAHPQRSRRILIICTTGTKRTWHHIARLAWRMYWRWSSSVHSNRTNKH